MDLFNRVVAVSNDENNAKLHVQFDQTRLDKHISMAVHSYSHGDCKTYTINKKNDSIHVQLLHYPQEVMREYIKHKPPGFADHGALPDYNNADFQDIEIFQKKRIRIPHGEYPTTLSVLLVIYDEIHKYYKDISRYALNGHPAQAHIGEYIQNALNHVDDYRIADPYAFEIINLQQYANRETVVHFKHCNVYITDDSPWKMLGFRSPTEDGLITREYTVQGRDLFVNRPFYMGFLSANIIKESYVNNQLTRNLCTMPLYNNDKMQYHEFTNLVFHPIEVDEFTDIVLEIKDENGDYMIFDKDVKTIITLVFKHTSQR